MAQWIKPNLKPQKWLLEKQSHQIPPNRIIKSEDANRNGKALANEREEARAKIREYCEQKNMLANVGFARSQRHYVRRLVTETIVNLVKWQKNAKKEAQAIETLARGLAQKIVSSPDLGLDAASRLDRINRELAAMLNWHLTLPKEKVDLLLLRHAELFSHLLGLEVLQAHRRKTGAELWINIEDISFKFDFFDGDIDKILRSVQNQLPSWQN
ncbi:MAG TPA: hypothetical protein VEL47_03895 [Myxococcota bacterium]|nr:hypothetical protein [Myxococcota bacterium]